MRDIVALPLAGRAMSKTMLRRTSALDGMEETYERNGKVVVRALNATSKLLKTIRHIERAGRGVLDTSVRRNSHEDVFFSLTGRTLRE
ncbi:MAG: hypothetical protein ACXV5F_07975 [Halobacteriota archaeon]